MQEYLINNHTAGWHGDYFFIPKTKSKLINHKISYLFTTLFALLLYRPLTKAAGLVK